MLSQIFVALIFVFFTRCILLQTFELVFLFMEFEHSYRPRGLAVEKSTDFGVSYSPMEYIVLDPSNDCSDLFNVSEKSSFVGSDGPGTVFCRYFPGDNSRTSDDFVCAFGSSCVFICVIVYICVHVCLSAVILLIHF